MESVDRSFSCGVVSAWEENIWLDRRERAGDLSARAQPRGPWERLATQVRRFTTRMQLGPLETGDRLEDEPGKRI